MVSPLYSYLYALIQLLWVTSSEMLVYLEKGESYIMDESNKQAPYYFQDPIHNVNLLTPLPHQINLSQDKNLEIINFKLGSSLKFLEIYILFMENQETYFKYYQFEHEEAIDNILQNHIFQEQLYNISEVSRCLNFSEYKNSIYILCLDGQDKLNLFHINLTDQTIISRRSEIKIQQNCKNELGILKKLFLLSCFGTTNWQIDEIILFEGTFQLNPLWDMVSFIDYFQLRLENENDLLIMQGYETFYDNLYLFATRYLYELQIYSKHSSTSYGITIYHVDSDIIDMIYYQFLNPIFITQKNKEEIFESIGCYQIEQNSNLNLLHQSNQKNLIIFFNSSTIIINEQFIFMEIDKIQFFDQLSLVVILFNNQLRIFQVEYTSNLITMSNQSLTLIEKYLCIPSIRFVNTEFVDLNFILEYSYKKDIGSLGTSSILIDIIDIPIHNILLKSQDLNLGTSIYKINTTVDTLQEIEEYKQLLFTYHKELQIDQYWLICSQRILKLRSFNEFEQGFEFIIQSGIDCEKIKLFYCQHQYFDDENFFIIQQNKQNTTIIIYEVNIQNQNVESTYTFNVKSSDIKILHNNFNYKIFILSGQDLILLDLHSNQMQEYSQNILYTKLKVVQLNYAIYYNSLSIYIDQIVQISQKKHINIFSIDSTKYQQIEDLIVFDNKQIIIALLTTQNKIVLLHYYMNEIEQLIFIKYLPTYEYSIILPLAIKYLEDRYISVEALQNSKIVILLFDIFHSNLYCLRSVTPLISENYYINNLGYLYFIFSNKLQVMYNSRIQIEQNIEDMNKTLILKEKLAIQMNQNKFQNTLAVQIQYYNSIIDIIQIKKDLTISVNKKYELIPLDYCLLVEGTIDQITSYDLKIISPVQAKRTNILINGETIKFHEDYIYTINYINQFQVYKIVKTKNEFDILLISSNTITFPDINCVDTLPFYIDRQNYILVMCFQKYQHESPQYMFFIYKKVEVQFIFIQLYESEKLRTHTQQILIQQQLIISSGYDLIMYDIHKIRDDTKLSFTKKTLKMPFNSIIYLKQSGLFLMQPQLNKTVIQQFDYHTKSIQQLYTIDYENNLLKNKILQLNSEAFIVAQIHKNTIEIFQLFPFYEKLATLKTTDALHISFLTLIDLKIDKFKQLMIETSKVDTRQHDITVYNFQFGQKELIYPTQRLYNISYYKAQSNEELLIFLEEHILGKKMLTFAQLNPQYYFQLNNDNNSALLGNIEISNMNKKISVEITLKYKNKYNWGFKYLILIVIHIILYHMIQKNKQANKYIVVVHK